MAVYKHIRAAYIADPFIGVTIVRANWFWRMLTRLYRWEREVVIQLACAFGSPSITHGTETNYPEGLRVKVGEFHFYKIWRIVAAAARNSIRKRVGQTH